VVWVKLGIDVDVGKGVGHFVKNAAKIGFEKGVEAAAKACIGGAYWDALDIETHLGRAGKVGVWKGEVAGIGSMRVERVRGAFHMDDGVMGGWPSGNADRERAVSAWDVVVKRQTGDLANRGGGEVGDRGQIRDGGSGSGGGVGNG
jgi:hypothetical protein